MAISRFMSFSLVGSGEPERVNARYVTADIFTVFGITPVVGRTFTPGEDLKGATSVVLISEQLWARKFASDANVIQKSITLDDTPGVLVEGNAVLPQPRYRGGPVNRRRAMVALACGRFTAIWTGTWASAPQGCGGGFTQQTLREIVHTSIGGTAVRVRISNTFGGGALQIRDVHVAQRTVGSSIDHTTDKALTFNGRPDVTVPAGMYAVSDGVDFAIVE